MHRYEVTDIEWDRISDKFPTDKANGRGRPPKANRDMFNGILWIAKSDAPWRDLPERFGPWQTVYERFTVWSKLGIFEEIFTHLSIDADLQDLSVDSSSVKVHQHASGAKRGQKTWKMTKE